MHNINIHSGMPRLDLQWMEEICIKPLLVCVPFAYVKTVSKGLSIMHETLLGGVYCNTLFLPVTIHAQVCIILWDMPVLNYSLTHLYHRIPFNKHEHIHILKDTVFFFFLQGYYNTTSVGPFGEVEILLPCRQNLSYTNPNAWLSL